MPGSAGSTGAAALATFSPAPTAAPWAAVAVGSDADLGDDPALGDDAEVSVGPGFVCGTAAAAVSFLLLEQPVSTVSAHRTAVQIIRGPTLGRIYQFLLLIWFSDRCGRHFS